MRFDPPLLSAQFVRRYKRFFADVELQDGSVVTAHCPNTGSMKNCLVANSPCWISRSQNPKRKLAYTLEAVTALGGGMAGVNTGIANRLIEEALKHRWIDELATYGRIQREVRYGKEASRLDFLLSSHESTNDEAKNAGNVESTNTDRASQGCCFVEVKSLTLAMGQGWGAFPDSKTTRGTRHLRELLRAKQEGYRAVLLFCVQHTDIDRVRPAWELDLEYSNTLVEVYEQGVEVLAYAVNLSPQAFSVERRLPFSLEMA